MIKGKYFWQPAMIGFVFLFSCFHFRKKEVQNEKYKVQGTATYTGAHCGGARLPDDMLQELMTPKPLSEKILYIRKGERNSLKDTSIVAEVKTNEGGEFVIELPPGKYFLVDYKKKDQTFYNSVRSGHKEKSDFYDAVDTLCLKTWYETPDATFEVVKGENNRVTVNYPNRCSWNKIPCVHYTGPLPP